MVMSLGTDFANNIQSMLHEYYRGPVADQLNNEILAVELLQKGSFTWSGKSVIIPLHTGRNTGVGYRNEAGDTGGSLPTATAQVHSRIVSNATFLYGRFEVTGPAMASAQKGGMHSFVGALDNEMTRLVDDIKNEANKNFFIGGRVRGFLLEKKAATITGGAATYHGTPGSQRSNGVGLSDDWDYDGDFSAFDGTWINPATGTAAAACLDSSTAGPATWVRIDLIRLDTYATLPLLGNDSGIFVRSVDKAAGQLELVPISSSGATVVFTTAPVPVGVGIAVALNQTQLATAADPTLKFGTTRDIGHEPSGILTNLFDSSLFNLARGDGAADGGETLQSTALTGKHATNRTAGTDDRRQAASIPLEVVGIQTLLDDIDELCGKQPDMFFVHNKTRQSYVAGAISDNQQIQQTTSATKATGADFGYNVDKIGYAGIPFRSSRHCPKRMIIAVKLDTWKLAELKAGDFADLDGAILSRMLNKDSWEGFWRWYHQIVCCYPNANGVVYGYGIN